MASQEGTTIDVQLRYLADVDNECPYISCPSVPRVGEYVVTPARNTYQVVRVIWDDATRERKAIVRLEVVPARKWEPQSSAGG